MASSSPPPSIAGSTGGGSIARFPRLASFVAALVVALMATGCVGDPPEVTADDPELVEGREIWRSSCAGCHGADGSGGLGTRLAGGAVVAAYPDVEDQIRLVAEGRNSMPAYEGNLDPEQIRAVVRYTREVL